jgi:hypothetical protein
MPNEKLLATYQETRNEIVQERGVRMGRSSDAEALLNDARLNLQQAQGKERLAVQADEDVKEKMRVLTDSLNGMTEKPQYLLDKVSNLGAEQLQTFRKRQAATEITRNRQREITEAQTALAVAQADMQAIDKDVADIDSKIREVRSY